MHHYIVWNKYLRKGVIVQRAVAQLPQAFLLFEQLWGVIEKQGKM